MYFKKVNYHWKEPVMYLKHVLFADKTVFAFFEGGEYLCVHCFDCSLVSGV